jgi:hypothetical protein
VNDQAKRVLGDALALSESDREDLAELLLTSLPRLSKRGQAEIEKAWVDEAISRAEALERGVDSMGSGSSDPAYAALAVRGREDGSSGEHWDYRKSLDIRDFRHAASGDAG